MKWKPAVCLHFLSVSGLVCSEAVRYEAYIQTGRACYLGQKACKAKNNLNVDIIAFQVFRIFFANMVQIKVETVINSSSIFIELLVQCIVQRPEKCKPQQCSASWCCREIMPTNVKMLTFFSSLIGYYEFMCVHLPLQYCWAWLSLSIPM